MSVCPAIWLSKLQAIVFAGNQTCLLTNSRQNFLAGFEAGIRAGIEA